VINKLPDHRYGASVPVYSVCASSQRDGQTELTRMARYIPREFISLHAVTHPSTNQDREPTVWLNLVIILLFVILNLVTISQTAAEFLQFSAFQNGGQPPSCILLQPKNEPSVCLSVRHLLDLYQNS